MESKLVVGVTAPVWDESLMRALALLSAPSVNEASMTLGVADCAGRVYRVVHTSGLYETVRIFESARDLGFGIGEGQRVSGHTFQRVLRRNH